MPADAIATAHHEAGHGIVGEHFGARIESIWIDGQVGNCRSDRLAPFESAVVKYAGHGALVRLLDVGATMDADSAIEHGAEGDWTSASELLGHDVRRIEAAQRRALALVERYAVQIRELAALLLRYPSQPRRSAAREHLESLKQRRVSCPQYMGRGRTRAEELALRPRTKR